MIGVLFLVKFLGAIKVILVGYILLHYTSITFVSINLGFELLIFLLIAVLMQLPFKDTLSQSK
ncbi:MAG: hypothetical protein H6767_01260 [Candidatus Peribacteria bacterium]|nr:MAG: hypothetical protein H6767_01260 [Candidatus Peribacteria bacterium]